MILVFHGVLNYNEIGKLIPGFSEWLQRLQNLWIVSSFYENLIFNVMEKKYEMQNK